MIRVLGRLKEFNKTYSSSIKMPSRYLREICTQAEQTNEHSQGTAACNIHRTQFKRNQIPPHTVRAFGLVRDPGPRLQTGPLPNPVFSQIGELSSQLNTKAKINTINTSSSMSHKTKPCKLHVHASSGK